MGRLCWGFYYLVGLAYFLVAALMPLWRDGVPLIYGVFVAVCHLRRVGASLAGGPPPG